MIYDLTQPIRTAMPVFPGDPEVRVEPWPTEAPWRVTAISLGSHSGTHIDAPRHCLPTGAGIGSLPPDRFVRPGVVLDAGGRSADALGIDIWEPFAGGVRPGWVVVLRTGWDRYWGDERYFRHPYLGPDLAAALAEAGVGLVGIDAPNVDATPTGGSTAHQRLLGADVLIVENVRGLDALAAGSRYVFAFLPLALGDVDAAPVRALAWDPDHFSDDLS